MLTTGLPYDLEKMDEIKENGAIVDMNSYKFDAIPDDEQLRTVFIFLRNTGFNVKLDFSNCDYASKRQYLLEYLYTKMDCKYTEFSHECVNIMYAINLMDPPHKDAIFTDEERIKFINEDKDVVDNLYDLVISTILFLVSKSKCFDIDMEHFEEKTTKIKINLVNIMKDDMIGPIVTFSDREPSFYKDIFNDDNYDLFVAVVTGLATESTVLDLMYKFGMDDFKTFVNYGLQRMEKAKDVKELESIYNE